MPGPWQTISQSDETIEVDISTRGWWFQYLIWLLKIVGNFSDAVETQTADGAKLLLQKSTFRGVLYEFHLSWNLSSVNTTF